MQRDELIEELGLGPVWKLRPRTGAVLRGQLASAPLSANAGEITDPDARPATQAPAPASPPRPKVSGGETPPRLLPASPAPGPAPGPAPAGWSELLVEIRACTGCGLCRQRRQAVPGVGDLAPDWLFIGEGPGETEDERGEPFVGEAGKLLDNMLAAIGLKRGEGVFIANAVKCRPPDNRPPTAEEIATCRSFLERQIALLKPKIIVLLGRSAASALLGEAAAGNLGALRGRPREYQGIPLIVTYHPAYLLRSPQEKARAWEDLCLAQRVLRGG